MSIRNTLLIIETTGRTANVIGSRLREQGKHCLWVNKPDIAIPLLDSKDRICAVLLIDDDPVEDSIVNNLKILKQISQKVPIITSTHNNSVELEKKIRKLGVFFYHTGNDGNDELKTAIECAFEKALKNNLFMTPPPGGGIKSRRKPC